MCHSYVCFYRTDTDNCLSKVSIIEFIAFHVDTLSSCLTFILSFFLFFVSFEQKHIWIDVKKTKYSGLALAGSLSATSISIGLFLYLSHYEMSEASQSGNNNGPGQIISSVRSIRLAIFLITTSLIATCAVFNVIVFSEEYRRPIDVVAEQNDESYDFSNNTNNYTSFTLPTISETTSFTISSSDNSDNQQFEIPPIYLFLCGLSLSAISAFLHAGFILKLAMMLGTVLIQTLILYTSDTFGEYELLSDEAKNSL